jgi:hypothetical protein
MSDTPETDAARHDLSDYGSPVLCSWGDWVDADFARKLERERDEAREALEFRRELYKVQEQCLETARRERDEAREQNSKLLREFAKHSIMSALFGDSNEIKEDAK